jgi:hypothetical protein
MPIQNPFRRNIRIFTDGKFTEGGRWRYLLHKKYAKSPEHFIRSFFLIQKDLHELFEYVEPSDTNLQTYSYRIHELLLRVCIEIEANCVAILTENGYKKSTDLNMTDYKKINHTHRLSSYQVQLPIWKGRKFLRQPFKSWETNSGLSWYRDYNATKHDRQSEFSRARFDSLIDAVCGLVALIASQFSTHDFSPVDYLVTEGPGDGFEAAIGGYFRIKFPTDWPESERYEFDWQKIENQRDPFKNIDYSRF